MSLFWAQRPHPLTRVGNELLTQAGKKESMGHPAESPFVLTLFARLVKLTESG